MKPRNRAPCETDLRDHRECRAAQISAKANVDIPALELTGVELPGVIEDGMPGRNGQRKPGTARGWPRRSRTAEAAHISRRAVKLRCAREQGGWGRLSDDGRDSITRTGARAPGVGGAFHRVAVQYIASTDPTLGGSTLKHEGRRQTGRRTAYAGSRLKLNDVPGRSRLIRQPSSRNGENPPCGMIGGTMETAASFEVRNAPSSYPTKDEPEKTQQTQLN